MADKTIRMEKQPFLFMVLLGANPKKRNVEQHDYYFDIADSIETLFDRLKAFWPDAGKTLHIDGWRKITQVENYHIEVVEQSDKSATPDLRLFFLNLGGYKPGTLEEQHFILLTVAKDRKEAIRNATNTDFFKLSKIRNNKSASPHIDEKFGLDVDDIFQVRDVLSADVKTKYSLHIRPNTSNVIDEIHLGYYKLKW